MSKLNQIYDIIRSYNWEIAVDFYKYTSQHNFSSTAIIDWVFAEIPRVADYEPILNIYSMATGKSVEYVNSLFKRESEYLPELVTINNMPIDRFIHTVERKTILGIEKETTIESDVSGIILSRKYRKFEVQFHSPQWVIETTFIAKKVVSKKIYLPSTLSEIGESAYIYRIED